MPTLKSSKFPPPVSWEEFELLCADLLREVWNDPGTQRNGRTGQPQHGVDVFGRPNGAPHYVGAQVRNKPAVTVAELREEVEKAKKFVPALTTFILATTAPNDASTQEEARRITSAHLAEGLFSVEVWSWSEIEARLADHPSVIAAHYPQFGLASVALKERRKGGQGRSFDLDYQYAPDNWIHLKVTNLDEPGDFYCDVTDVIGARDEQTVPYPVKWRGDNVEKKFIVREALIDLARGLWHPGPDINSGASSVFFIRTHGHTADGWDSGYWELFSHSKPDGWIVEAADHVPADASVPPRVRLFFEEIHLEVRVVCLSSNEERKWRVTLGFPLPEADTSHPGGWRLPDSTALRDRVGIVEL